MANKTKNNLVDSQNAVANSANEFKKQYQCVKNLCWPMYCYSIPGTVKHKVYVFTQAQLQELTGLSRTAVLYAAQRGEASGFFQHAQTGGMRYTALTKLALQACTSMLQVATHV